MDDSTWILGLRTAGVFHFVTLAVAWFTPIPPDWEKNLAGLPETHRRFAVAQNLFIGATIAFCGVLSLGFANELAGGSPLARVVNAGIALWWGGRLVVLGWLRVTPHFASPWLKIGFTLLQAECAIYAAAYGWLVFRHG